MLWLRPHPAYRRRGIASATTARLCQSLLSHTTHIGLVVQADKSEAVRCYEQLGFAHRSLVEVCVLGAR